MILYQPEIPPNTGNVIRLCANTGAGLHLIEPLGFALDDKRLRRAGLDYHEFAALQTHASLEACLDALGRPPLYAFSTHADGDAFATTYPAGAALLFGPETRGLPTTMLQQLPAGHCLRLPLRPGNRSLNLSNAVAVAVYEAWRQHGFPGAR